MIRNLAYVGFTSPSASAWRAFAPEVLGAQIADVNTAGSGDGDQPSVRLRFDTAPWRVAIHDGAQDDLAYVGWDVGDEPSLQALSGRLEASGIAVSTQPTDGCRPSETTAWFNDPFGIRHELSVMPAADETFTPPRPFSGFVTGDNGIGHLVLIVPDLQRALGFFIGTLGLVSSDTIETFTTLRFLHAPGHASRHHCLALAELPGMVGVHHLMVEVAELDDVGRALDAARGRGDPIVMDLGRHTNDHMTSFYVRTPSGFEIEYGTGGILIDDATWHGDTYDAISIWGHRPPATGPAVPGILRPVERASTTGDD